MSDTRPVPAGEPKAKQNTGEETGIPKYGRSPAMRTAEVAEDRVISCDAAEGHVRVLAA